MRLDRRRAFITGAGSGIGAAIALAFAREGARVFVTDKDGGRAAEIADRCNEVGQGSESFACDVTDSAAVKDAFARMDRAIGGVDILVNNAGIIHTDPEYVERVNRTMQAQAAELMSGEGIHTHWDTIEALTDEMFDRMIRTHLYGTFYCTREALARMRKQGSGGRIINLGSIMGTASLPGAPDYCAAKGAILAFTRATAREAASYGVLANAIAPGFIDTPLLDPIDEGARRLIVLQTPLGRLGRDDEIAATAVFLASEDSGFFTGQVLSPNGGIYMSQ